MNIHEEKVEIADQKKEVKRREINVDQREKIQMYMMFILIVVGIGNILFVQFRLIPLAEESRDASNKASAELTAAIEASSTSEIAAAFAVLPVLKEFMCDLPQFQTDPLCAESTD